MSKISVLIFVCMTITSCVTLKPVSEEFAVDESKAMIKELAGALSKKLKDAVIKSGFVDAIDTCSQTALKTARDISKKKRGSIRRVSLKLRNIKNAPDEYEHGVLVQMDQDNAKKELKDFYQDVITDKKGRSVLRMMKPIITKSLCLNCHGTPYTWKKEAIGKILELYPEDTATGYATGQVRGAFSVQYPIN